MTVITISVQSSPRDLQSWTALARQAEAAGFGALLAGDHPGSGPSPWPSLGAAAAVTTTLQLGTYVLQTGVTDPISVAADAATLEILAPRRVLLGLGAGHTFREWEATGRPRPSAGARATRFVEFSSAVEKLLDGQSVTARGDYLELVNAQLDGLPVGERRVRLVVGGGHPRILAFGAEHADVVALSGLGRTRPDGHRHEVRWTSEILSRQLGLVHDHAARAGTNPALEALVQVVTVTDQREQALADLAVRVPDVSVEDLGSAPYLLVGTIEQMVDQLRRQAETLGITRYVVRDSAVEPMEQVIRQLAQ